MEVANETIDNLPFYGVECAESISFRDNNINVSESFFIRLFIDDETAINNIVVSDCNVNICGDVESLVEIISQFPPATEIEDVGDSNIYFDNCVLDCPESVVTIKTNGGEIVMKNLTINCKKLMIESTIFGKILIGKGCKFNARESIDFLCGGGDTVIDESVSISCGGKLFSYNAPYTPIVSDERADLITVTVESKKTNTSRFVIFENANLKIAGTLFVVCSDLLISAQANVSTGAALLEVKSPVLLQGNLVCEKCKISAPLFIVHGSVESRNEIILNCGEIVMGNESRLISKGVLTLQSANKITNFGEIVSRDINGWFGAVVTQVCAFENFGSVTLDKLDMVNDQHVNSELFYHIQILNRENAKFVVKGITKILANMTNSRITLNNEGTFQFKGDFKTLFQHAFGEIIIMNYGFLEFNSNFSFFGKELNSEGKFTVRGQTKVISKNVCLSGSTTFGGTCFLTSDYCSFENEESEVVFQKDLVLTVCSDMSTVSKLDIKGSLTINMSSSQLFNHLTMNNIVKVGVNFTITAPNILTDNLDMKQETSGSKNEINAMNSQFNGNLSCSGDISFKVKNTADFNSTIYAQCSEFTIGTMTGKLSISGEESVFSVDYLFGNLSMNLTKGAKLIINKEAGKDSTIDIKAEKISLVNKGKQDGKKVKLQAAEDILSHFCFDMSSEMNISSSNGNVTHLVDGSVKKEQKVKAKRVIFICGDTIEAPSAIEAQTQAFLRAEKGVTGNISMQSNEISFLNQGDQSGCVLLTGQTISSTVEGNMIGAQSVSGSVVDVTVKGDTLGEIKVAGVNGGIGSVSTISTNNVYGRIESNAVNSNVQVKGSVMGEISVIGEKSNVDIKGDLQGHLKTYASSRSDITVSNVSGSINSNSQFSNITANGYVSGNLQVTGVNSSVTVSKDMSGTATINVRNDSTMSFGNVTQNATINSNSKTGKLDTNEFQAKSSTLKGNEGFSLNAKSINVSGTMEGGKQLYLNSDSIKNSGSISGENISMKGTSLQSTGSITSKNQLSLNINNISLGKSSKTEGALDIKSNVLKIDDKAILTGKGESLIKSTDIKNSGLLKGSTGSTLRIVSDSFDQRNTIDADTLIINSKSMINDGTLSAKKAGITTDSLSLQNNSKISGNTIIIDTKKLADTKDSSIKVENLKIDKQGKDNLKSDINVTNIELKSDDYDIHNLKNIHAKNVKLDISNISKTVNRNLEIDPNIQTFDLKVKNFTNNSSIKGNIHVNSSGDIINQGSIAGKSVSLISDGNIDLSKGTLHGTRLEQVRAGKKIILPPKNPLNDFDGNLNNFIIKF